MSNLLQIQNLSVDFISDTGQTTALQDVSIEVNKGEIVAIVGESGSGKSVTALSVLQLIPAPPAFYKNGAIIANINNESIGIIKAPRGKLQELRGNKIAMIFQEPMTSLNPVMTCGKQVMEAMLTHKNISPKEAGKKTIDLFEKVKLPDPKRIFSSYPHQLSGGQKQRVMIAMAMSCEPSLLICDEPTTALDVTVQKNILDLIKELQVQNEMGVIFITHDLGIVGEIADRVIVIYKGKIVEQNTAANLFIAPQHPYTKALLACRPALHPKGERLPVVSDFMEVKENGEIVERPAIIQHHARSNPGDTSMNAETLITVEHLKVYYPAKKTFLGKILSYTKAVDDVNFEVRKGETLGLVGESGCGKTTLGRAILRLIGPTGGKIIYKGTDLSIATPSQLKTLRKEMQIIFQDPYSSLHPRKTIGAAIAEPLKVHKLFPAAERKARVLELLQKVGLQPGHYDRYPHEFSGGQRQRIVIARALALQPSFIVCDESVSALDVSMQAQVLNLLNDLKKEFDLTLVFISHDLSVVRYISDRIIVMNKGKIEETGSAEDIYLRPRSPYTQKLLSAIPKGYTA